MRRLLPALVLLPVLTLPALAERPGDSVVAVVAGETITLDQVDATGDTQLTILKDQLHWARMAAVEDLVSRRLLETEAAEQGLSLSSYVESEITSKVADPTSEEIAAFWAANPNAAPPEAREGLTESIKGFLKRELTAPLRQALIARLRAKHAPNLKYNLPSARVALPVEGRPTEGKATAPVTLVAFTDYQCGGCAALVQELEALEANFGDNVRVAHFDFPSESHERALPAAIAARCAGRFGKYWTYHDRLFTDVADLSDERLISIASELSLDLEGFGDCRADPAVAAEVETDRALGLSVGVVGTPHLFVNGLSLKGGLSTQHLAQIIAMELDRLGVAPPPGG